MRERDATEPENDKRKDLIFIFSELKLTQWPSSSSTLFLHFHLNCATHKNGFMAYHHADADEDGDTSKNKNGINFAPLYVKL